MNGKFSKGRYSEGALKNIDQPVNRGPRRVKGISYNSGKMSGPTVEEEVAARRAAKSFDYGKNLGKYLYKKNGK